MNEREVVKPFIKDTNTGGTTVGEDEDFLATFRGMVRDLIARLTIDPSGCIICKERE